MSTHPLGKLIHEYRINQGELVRRIALPLIAAAILFFIIRRVDPLSLDWIAQALGVLMLLLVGAFTVWMFSSVARALMLAPRIRVYEKGVAVVSPAGEQSWRWDQFTLFYGWFTGWRLMNAITITRTGAHKFYAGSTLALQVTQLYDQPTQLYSHMATNIAKAMLPHLIARYDAGETLSFGAVTLAKSGLVMGGQTIPVKDIKSHDTKQKQITVYGKGQQVLAQCRLQNLPNVTAFLGMLNYITQKR
ncbi:MAG: hypothetical protein IAE80_13070 [Anaerolinea sp.]|nr:hypothetical protein [Anaerolinea sp.]